MRAHRSLLLFFWAILHIAQPISAAGGGGSLQSMKFSERYFQAANPNSTPQSQQIILMELLGSSASGYNWPEFPRTFSKVSDWKAQDTTTSLGLDVNAIAYNLGLGGPLTSNLQAGVTVKRNFKYSYTFNVTLYVMSSYKGGISNDDITEGNLQQITRMDPATERTYFKSSTDNPMVGFCSIEAGLDIVRSTEVGIRYIIGNSGHEEKEGRSYSHALFTKFFQIEPDVPMSHYLEVYCRDEFSTYARPVVEADFNNMVVEETIHNNPLNRCKMPEEKDPFGDQSCVNWHAQKFPMEMRQRTVARCLVDNDKPISRCELRARKGHSCGLYIDHDGNYTEEFHLYRDATTPGFSQPCDEGLKCVMQKKPLKIGPIVFWPGYATCQ